jgi:quinoprotein glucose dehydrogenase
MQYSALEQIGRGNVRDLTRAWSFTTPGAITGFAFNPLVVDDTLYVLGGDRSIIALDAATGAKRWSRTVAGTPTYRGFNYWQSADGKDHRLIFSADSVLYEIDAANGAPVATFGDGGRVNLRDGIARAGTWPKNVQSNTPGRVFENLLLLGSASGEEYETPPGDIRAYDVLTGGLVWTFHTIPRPGEFGYETWPPDAWQRYGGTNVWGEISVDEARGIAYFPIGSPTYDFYGGQRAGTNLFGDCLLALDARTGKRLWHQQLVHHDLWDYDLTAAPKLLTVQHDGRAVDVVAQATKSGFVYVFERETGAPLWPIEERPVPQSDVPGEASWPTQPFPSKPPAFARQSFTPADLNPYLDAGEQARLRGVLQGLRNEGIFTPPSLGGSIVVPGAHGGANFAATAADPRKGMLYVRNIDRPGSNRLTTTRPSDYPVTPPVGETRYYGQFASVIRATNGLPAVAPPWSELIAYDLNQGTIAWRVPLSTMHTLPAGAGVKPTGIEYAWRNGPVVTAGGLLFCASASDRLVHAYDANTGEVLWEEELPANPDGIPAVYESAGREYVVFFAASIARGGTAVWKSSPASAQGYYAFALPK